ncbi:protein MCM10 homolog [Anopheles aquasalis]|uniref:protein MCM10 homolog n=1 Tax=Anopheles aquasalis TaxID=42839 RepID=UPI00215A6A6D|nr:protein MCM10 homolog [Anopheles aquasalis]
MSADLDDLNEDELEQLLLETLDRNARQETPAESAPSSSKTESKPALSIEGSTFLLQDTESPSQAETSSTKTSIADADIDSSDDEETRNFLERKYNQYGRQINDLLKSKEEEKTDQALSTWVDRKLMQIKRSTAQKPASIAEPSPQAPTNAPRTPNVGTSRTEAQKPSTPGLAPVFQGTVHTDPVFGIRIVHPLISSQTLVERMEGKKPVPFMRLRHFIETADLQQDWVIGGVLVSKSPTKTTSKGKQFAIWKLSDLHGDVKMATLFLFSQAYKDLWKTTEGTVVAVLNPNVLNNNNDRSSEATLSIDRSTKVMILGQSRDLGTCRSRKKNGDRCTAIISLGQCEYCVYHIKQEYNNACNRGGLLTSTGGRGLNELRNKVLGKNEVFYAGQSYSAIKAVKNPKQVEKDRQRMLTLSDYYRPPAEGNGTTGSSSGSPIPGNPSYRASPVAKVKPSAARVETKVGERVKDLKRLESLGVSLDTLKAMTSQPSSSPHSAPAELKPNSPSTQPPPFSLNSKPSLSREAFEIDIIPRTVSVAKALQSRARATAILKQKPIEKSNPNFIKYRGTEQGKKRVLEEVVKNAAGTEENAAKRPKIEDGPSAEEQARNDFIKRMMQATSSHKELVVASENAAQEEYFHKLERKEAMEEKMLNTFKVACKAVSCSQCKYIAFSAADRCKTEGHQLKVRDAEKRFFRCADCGNRTVSLFRIPKVSCKSCQGSRWERCAMMREKRGIQVGDVLSIRGDEEKYLGSLAGANASLNLLMPEES